ncbi:MAG TPA: (d)CMP kinase [Actinomycetota bacterium]
MDPPVPLVIAIDGPAGAGKTTVARGVARALGIAHLDTGAMYRALTAKALARGVEPTNAAALAELADGTGMTFAADGLVVDGSPVGPEIRGREVNRWVSTVAAHPKVRAALVAMQRRMMAEGEIVAEGRDIGTVVCPDAPVKVFLTASPEERAQRRHAEVEATGEPANLEDLRQEITHRDQTDSTRETSPLVPAEDAVLLDTTGKTPEQVVDAIVQMARRVTARDR